VRNRRFTLILAALTALTLLLSAPAALREAGARGGFYLFSRDFLEDLPRRLMGPGRFRFFFQPLFSILLGLRNGREDAKAGRPAFFTGLFFHQDLSRELRKSGISAILNLVLMGILLDSLFQWLILGTSYPVPALIVGPVLITAPYALARDLAKRCSRPRNDGGPPPTA
jgi:hypothetical protein